ncbi:MAG: FxsA family protein [Marinobacter sp.]|uniref:FxsA family protein n=1 Tax=Marinobacter sp. TaxID=50741 RepID=UPI0034A0A74E
MGIFLLIFIILPIVEMAILIKVGTVIGALSTIGLVLLTAIIGAALLRQQGLATLLRANQRINSGELPAREVAEGLILAVGGALLLTPGFVTDAIGLLCLIPFTRQWFASHALKRMVVASGSTQSFRFTGGQGDPFGSGNAFGGGSAADDDVIEGEYREEREGANKSSDRLEKK